jgi:lambda family phage portal protein
VDLIALAGLVAPGLTAGYLRRRAQLAQAQRLYDAARPSQYRRPVSNRTSGDAVMDATYDKLRQLARHLDENHDLVIAVLDDLVNNVIGSGIRVAPLVRKRDGTLAEEVNDRILEAWQDWARRPEVTKEHAWPQVERLAALSMFRDGEVFLQHVTAQAYEYPTATRYAIELIEADMVPFDHEDAGRNLLHGIQCNEWNAPIAYYLYRKHPGGPLATGYATKDDLKVLPASLVSHLKHTRRIGQRRGVPILHAVLNRLSDLKDYEDSERIAARVAASFTGFIKRTAEYQSMGSQDAQTGARLSEMSPGMIFELQPGEDAGTIGSNRPNTGLEAFRNAMLRAVAGGTGTRYSSISRDYNGTYSSQRQELVEAAIAYRAWTGYVVEHLHRPVYERWIEAAALSGVFGLGGLRGIDPGTLKRVDFRAPVLPWIDPGKEASAYQTLVDAGLESRSEIMRARGRDPATVWAEIEEEQASGLFTSTVAAAAVPPQAPDEDPKKDDAETDDQEAAA